MTRVRVVGVFATVCFLLISMTAGPAPAQDREHEFRIDHFKAYEVEAVEAGGVVGLRGQFDREVVNGRLDALTHFANPVSKNDGKILNANAHLTWYRLEQKVREPKRQVTLHNQFGTQRFTLGPAAFLLVPAEKLEHGSSFPYGLDHFKCYEVLEAETWERREVKLADQFGEEEAHVMAPRLFCVPVEKFIRERQVTKIKNRIDHLAFYELPRREYSEERKFRDQFGHRVLKAHVSVLLGVPSLKDEPPPTGETCCIYFDGLTLGTTYGVGDVFADHCAKIFVKQFQWWNLIWTSGGHASVQNGGLAGGAGNEIAVNNVNLAFDFGASYSNLTLRFGEYGGNLNIEINGVLKNFADFINIDGGNIGGVTVAVASGGFGNDQGSLALSGTISSFSVGGQELWIDNVCIKR